MRKLGCQDKAFRNDCFTFTSKPIDKTIPSFSMKIRLDEIPLHQFSFFSFQFPFNWKFICFSLGLLKESTQFGISQCALSPFQPPSSLLQGYACVIRSANQNIYLLPRSQYPAATYKQSLKEFLIEIPSCISSRPFFSSPCKTNNLCKYYGPVYLSASDTPLGLTQTRPFPPLLITFHQIPYNLRYTIGTCTLRLGVRFS